MGGAVVERLDDSGRKGGSLPEEELTETDVRVSWAIVEPSVVPMEPEDLDEEGGELGLRGG